MNILKFRNIIQLSLIICLAYTAKCHACECLPVASAVEAQKSSTLVFEGQVLQLKRFSLSNLGKDYKEFAVRMRVIRSWKGDPTDYIIVRTPAEEKNCGFDFQSGSTYIVYALAGPIPLVTKCSRTSLTDSQTAKNDKKTLGLGIQPGK